MSEAMKPKRRFTFKSDIGADSLKDLESALQCIIFDIARGSRESVSGSPSAGYFFKLEENPEQTHESYIEQLNQYLENSRAEAK